MKIIQAIPLFLYFTLFALADEVTGFWTTLNEDSGKRSSIIAIYPYEGNYYGRIIATYNNDGIIDDSIYHPKDRAPGIEGHPYYSGIDIVWEMKPKSSGKCKGSIIDPTKGKSYRAEIWRKGADLILRGKLFIFAKNITWPPFPENEFTDELKKPDISTFIPKKPITI